MIGIQPAKGGFDIKWISYCNEKSIPYKLVDCYRFDIIDQLKDCQALMWQFYQGSTKDFLVAKQILFAVEQSGTKVFPNFNTSWHFDDKIGQKYLLEAIVAPIAPVWVFYDKHEALIWAKKTDFPKVFKLRWGAGSQNVKLVKSVRQAISLINKAFSKGFPAYDAFGSLKERWRLYRLGKARLKDVFKGVARFFIRSQYVLMKGREKGYIYFQEFIPGNDCDIRVIVIADKAFAIKRMVRKNDFRASGSGHILYEKELFDEGTILLSFEIAQRLKSQCVAFDFVYKDKTPLILEINYGFSPSGYESCPGFWDKNLNWHEGKFNPYGWMVDSVLK
jgi:glutathione synthase/RimK-type ligase-like ATP-grasp enzyme